MTAAAGCVGVQHLQEEVVNQNHVLPLHVGQVVHPFVTVERQETVRLKKLLFVFVFRSVISFSRPFHSLGAWLLKAESPTVVLLCGTAKREEPDDLRSCPSSQTKTISLIWHSVNESLNINRNLKSVQAASVRTLEQDLFQSP